MKPYYADDHLTVYLGDCREVLRELPDESVHCVVTSPPYWGLRDYGVGGQLGLEPTPEAYIAAMVEVFREVRRVLRKDGTLWLNMGDSYAAQRGGTTMPAETLAGGQGGWMPDGSRTNRDRHDGYSPSRNASAIGLKHKDLVGMPWRLALALQADGWWLRSDIIWSKPNPMPESVTDRPTKAHEYVFLLTKAARYYYDADAVREPASTTRPELLAFGDERPDRGHPGHSNDRRRIKVPGGWDVEPGAHGTIPRDGRTEATYRPLGDKLADAPAEVRGSASARMGRGAGWRKVERERNVGGRADGFTRMPGGEAEWAANGRPGRNLRDVWTIPSEPYPGAHFATFPRKLVEPCILAGCPPDGVVLDPFAGSGTTLLVAQQLGRRAIGIDLSADYMGQCLDRNRQAPLGLVG